MASNFTTSGFQNGYRSGSNSANNNAAAGGDDRDYFGSDAGADVMMIQRFKAQAQAHKDNNDNEIPGDDSGATNTYSPAQMFKSLVTDSFRLGTSDSDSGCSSASNCNPFIQIQTSECSVMDSFTRIFSPILSDPARIRRSSFIKHNTAGKLEEEFAGPNQVPHYYKFQQRHWARGLIVTISHFESADKIFMYNHSASGRLMDLETEMSQWYGAYLMRKRLENTDVMVEIVPRGFYAVYIASLNIWARCYVQSIMPTFRAKKDDPDQMISVVLFDYDGNPQVFPRKYFLRLKKTFLELPVQKVVGRLDWATRNKFPWNCDKTRAIVEGRQFSARLLSYNTSTEPFPELTLELADLPYDSGNLLPCNCNYKLIDEQDNRSP